VASDVFALTDRATVKALLNIRPADTDRDTEIDLQIRAVSGQIAWFCNRGDAIERRTRTEVHDVSPGQRVWQLKAYPVTSLIEVALDWNREFGPTTALDATAYTIRKDAGIFTMDYALVPYGARRRAQVLQMVYVGGVAETLSALRSAHPDLELAAHYQIQHNMKRREGDPGQSSVNVGGATRTTPALDLLPYVKSILAPYVRHRVGNG